MSFTLYPNLLTDESQYKKAEVYWRNLWQEVLREAGSTGEWRSPWINNSFRDGNPIFSAISEQINLGVRIIQHELAEPDELDLDWWTDSLETEPEPVTELVISCVLSDQTARKIRDLLYHWVTQGRLPAEG